MTLPLLFRPPPAPRRRTRASSRSCSLRSDTGKKRHSLTEPSLRLLVPGEETAVTAARGGGVVGGREGRRCCAMVTEVREQPPRTTE